MVLENPGIESPPCWECPSQALVSAISQEQPSNQTLHNSQGFRRGSTCLWRELPLTQPRSMFSILKGDLLTGNTNFIKYVLRTTRLSTKSPLLFRYLLRHTDPLSHLIFTGQPLYLPETREPELSTNPWKNVQVSILNTENTWTNTFQICY